jgi:CRISPR system Cascade subunit CasE
MAKGGVHHKKGAEVDAFLARCWDAGEGVGVEREGVYRDWLDAHLERLGGARLISATVSGFKLERMIRRTHGDERRSVRVERPDVLFKGELEVTDPDRFPDLLGRGIGRHRAFGFGMLLLRPAESL